MIDAATRNTLVDILQRERCSLLMYVSEAFPLTTPAEQKALDDVLAMVKEEEHAAIRLAKFLQQQRIAIPPLGAFPLSYTTINFISLDYIVPLLIDNQKRRIEEITAQLSRVSDPAARKHIQEILDTKKRHMQSLEGIRGKTAA